MLTVLVVRPSVHPHKMTNGLHKHLYRYSDRAKQPRLQLLLVTSGFLFTFQTYISTLIGLCDVIFSYFKFILKDLNILFLSCSKKIFSQLFPLQIEGY